MLALVVNWARTPPLARADEPWPTDASRSSTTTRSTPASRSSRPTDSPMTPAPTTATSTVSGTPPGPRQATGASRALALVARRSARPMRPRPSSRWMTWISQCREPVSRLVWVSPTMGTSRPQTAATATRRGSTPALAARTAWVHRASTSRIPSSWCRSTRPVALPVQNRTPRASWTTQTMRMPIWMAVMVDRMVLLLSSGEPAGADQAGLVGEHDQLGPVAGPELDHGPADVGLGRGRADDQLVGDLVVGQAGRDQPHDLALALGELVELGRGAGLTGPGGELGHQPPGHPGRQQGVAGGDRPDPADQVGRLGVLDQEAAGPDAQGLEHVLVQVEGGEDDDADPGQQLVGGDGPGRLQAVQAGHA